MRSIRRSKICIFAALRRVRFATENAVKQRLTDRLFEKSSFLRKAVLTFLDSAERQGFGKFAFHRKGVSGYINYG